MRHPSDVDLPGQTSRIAPRAVLLALMLAAAPALAAEPETTQPEAAPQGGGPNAGSAVIRPPAGVDPGINKTPAVGQPAGNGKEVFPTPVVPPPGAPGGNPNVVPK